MECLDFLERDECFLLEEEGRGEVDMEAAGSGGSRGFFEGEKGDGTRVWTASSAVRMPTLGAINPRVDCQRAGEREGGGARVEGRDTS